MRSAIVLCGGRSSRMGRDKAQLPFGEETLVTRVARIASSVTTDIVAVGARHQDLPQTLRVARDEEDGLGPLSGLIAGIRATSGDPIALVACDMPLIEAPLLVRLFDLMGGADACVPLIDGMAMTTCAIYARAVLPRAEQRIAHGERSLRGLLETLHVRWVSGAELRDVDADLHSFMDCDTPEAYAAALRYAGVH